MFTRATTWDIPTSKSLLESLLFLRLAHGFPLQLIQLGRKRKIHIKQEQWVMAGWASGCREEFVCLEAVFWEGEQLRNYCWEVSQQKKKSHPKDSTDPSWL